MAGAYSWQPYHLHVPIVLKSGSLNLLETSGSVQGCNGIASNLQRNTSDANLRLEMSYPDTEPAYIHKYT